MSMVMDHFHDKWKLYPTPEPAGPPAITPAEIEEFRKLLERAREYDRRMNQPDCELDEKRLALKQLARALGVEIVFLEKIDADQAQA
jgi:hypothetical protein